MYLSWNGAHLEIMHGTMHKSGNILTVYGLGFIQCLKWGDHVLVHVGERVKVESDLAG